MFARLGRLIHRRRWAVLGAAAVLTVVAGALGPAVSESVRGGGFDDPSAESTRAAEIADDAFGRTEGDVVVLWSHGTLRVDDPAFGRQVTELLASLPADAVAQVVHPWSPGLPAGAGARLLGDDGSTAMAVLSLRGADEDARSAAYDQIADLLHAPAPWQTHITGEVPLNEALQHAAEEDIARAEMLAMPVLLVLMALIFGSLTAAALPITVGVVAILGAMGLLRLLTLVTDVSTFALNVTTILGLGLAIDYSLFMVSRFREELGNGGGTADVGAAVARTVATAGRTVAFSGLTVLIAFGGLLFFPQMFLRSMGLGGMAVVLLDMVLALTLLPALLAVLGRRVEAGRLPESLTRRLFAQRVTVTGGRPRTGGWERLARGVLRRPGVVAVGAALLLAVLALPALGLQPGGSGARDLPESSAARVAADVMEERFPAASTTALDVVVQGPVDATALAAYAVRIETLPGVTGVTVNAAVTVDGTTTTRLAVGTSGTVDDPATRDLVHRVRDAGPPDGATSALVGGPAAAAADSITAITSTLPRTLPFVAGVTAVLLFLALGSVVLPLKAVLMNVVSLGATFGVIAWAFGEGHLAGLLGFTGTGHVEPSNLVLVAVISFGLAMDYELFLLSRIREEHLRGASRADSIATGLQRSGRTITSAALLLVVVLVAMGTSGVTFLKVIGLGLAFAVAVDATVVRALLVPATMQLLGRANWWLPRPLARFHARFGFAEDEGSTAPPIPAAPGRLLQGGAPRPARDEVLVGADR